MSILGPILMVCVGVIVGFGIWRATARQKDGGCPCCRPGEDDRSDKDSPGGG